MASPRDVLDQIVGSISPASEAQAAGARARLAAKSAPRESLGSLERVAERLAAARHAPRPAVDAPIVVVCAADHGVADPGVDLGENAPTIVAVRHVASGKAAVNAAARAAGARVMIVDCGVRGGDRHDLGAGVLDLRVADTGDIRTGAAMTPIDALQAVQSGIALALSVVEDGANLIAVGALSTGSHTVSGAIIAAVCGNADDFGDEDRAAIAEALAAAPPAPGGIDLLAAVGGADIGVVTGIILGAAAINVPVLLDDHTTWAAALIAQRLAPASRGYLIASHAGASPAHRAALAALALEPLFDLGISQGEGTGAALALPMVTAAAQLLDDPR